LNPADHSPPVQREPDSELPLLGSGLRQSIRRVRVAPGDKPVALTFDLCEQADDITGYDRAIINMLRGQQVPATFFAGGKWMRNHEEKTQQLMADPRFEIGNHGWTHGNLRVLSGERMLQQIVWTQGEYQRIRNRLAHRAEQRGLGALMDGIPRQPASLRFPYGTCSAESLRAVNDRGLTAIQWDVVSGDAARGQSASALAREVLRQVRPGSIVVFHANGRGHGTAAALPEILKGLREQDYRFVTVSQLLREGRPETVPECYERRPGDNRKYDALFGEGTE
ncbi:MAG: polysaccharide deacetylase family protein, partial [Methylococcaceae bacterium]|nr:polysaccharide deacetylase family protein [Methylococcaceae bacterium]